MSVNASQRTHEVGATAIVVGLSAVVTLQAAAKENGIQFKYFSGGTLGICNGPSTVVTTYHVGTSELVIADGPFKFYLSAAGATTTVHAIISKSAAGVAR